MPIGTYTQTVLENLGIKESELNIVSKEPDVKSIVAKVITGAADAGFVYVTDAMAAGDKVKQSTCPERERHGDLSDRCTHRKHQLTGGAKVDQSGDEPARDRPC